MNSIYVFRVLQTPGEAFSQAKRETSWQPYKRKRNGHRKRRWGHAEMANAYRDIVSLAEKYDRPLGPFLAKLIELYETREGEERLLDEMCKGGPAQ